MGLNIVLEDEKGTQIGGVGDPTNILHRILPSSDDVSSRTLRYVDWYGDTVFNRVQMDDVIEELQVLLSKAQSHDERELLGQILELARKCKNEPHLYLKFYGD